MKFEINFKVDVSEKDMADAYQEGYTSIKEYLEDMFEGYDEVDCPEINVDINSLKIKKVKRQNTKTKGS